MSPSPRRKKISDEFGTVFARLRELHSFPTQQALVDQAALQGHTLTLKQIQDIEQGYAGLTALATHLPILCKLLELDEDRSAVLYELAGLAYPYHDTERTKQIVEWLLKGDHPPYLFPRTDTDEGRLKWLISHREYTNQQQRQIIELGIEIFEKIVKGRSTMQEILAQSTEPKEYLQGAVKSAFRAKVIQIIDVKRDRISEEKIAKYFPGVQALVADIPPYDSPLIRAEVVAQLAATDGLGSVTNERAIGMGPGYTLARFAALSHPSIDKFRLTRWIPLSQELHASTRHISANQVVCVMARQHPGSQAYYFPYMAYGEEISRYSKERYEEIIRYSKQMNEAFVTVTNVGRDESLPTSLLSADGIKGDGWELDYLFGNRAALFCGQISGIFLDTNGNPLSIEPAAAAPRGKYFDLDMKYKLEILDILRDIVHRGHVWIVAAGAYKVRPILRALESKLSNRLIIDHEIADNLIRTKENQQLSLFDSL